MGCCLAKAPKGPKPDPTPVQTRTSSRSAPPPEEETETVVKEVLSETPKPKPVNLARPVTQQKPVVPEIHKASSNTNVEFSEASDITDSTVTENTVEEFSSEFRRRSPAKIRRRNNCGERREWGAPARKPGPSPGRERRDFGERNVKMRDFGAKTREFGDKTREFGDRNVKNGDFGERNVKTRDFGDETRDLNERKVERRDFGETSGRRDKSPAMRPGLGRSGSARKTGKSPVRFMDPARVVDEREKMEQEGGKVGAEDESLENPLVSLECFIFL